MNLKKKERKREKNTKGSSEETAKFTIKGVQMTRNLLMKCMTEGCEEEHELSEEPMKDWAFFVRHKKGHSPRLIDTDTGEILASNPLTVKKALITEGLLKSSGDDKPKEKPMEQPKKGLKPTQKEGKYLYEGFFRTETVPLDPSLKLYLRVFKDEGLVPENTKIGEFLLGVVETLLAITGREIRVVQRKE